VTDTALPPRYDSASAMSGCTRSLPSTEAGHFNDATRLVYVEVLDDEKAATAVGFLRRAVAHFAAFGIQVERLMTDNGSA
jgi:hypothetical protein